MPIREKVINTLEIKAGMTFRPSTEEAQNCATRGAMAQLKTQWRNERGAN
jgi:hypothetical protein